MANIKISELNVLTERADNDLLAIVDTSADETKKIQVSDLINKNIELIAVSDTAPSECSIGDKYYNTTDKEIYTATGTNTWSDTGTTPISGILYIVYNDQASYSWDGTDLVSVGGGKEDIVIDDEEPIDPDVKLWIDTGEVGIQASEITNEYSTSTGKGYSANISNGTIIYQDTTGEGTITDITLTDSLNNYKYIDIICKRATAEANSSGYSIHKFPANAPSITLDFSYLGANNLVEYTTVYSMSGTSITILYNVIKSILLSNNTSSLSLTNGVRITKIIGYKLGER